MALRLIDPDEKLATASELRDEARDALRRLLDSGAPGIHPLSIYSMETIVRTLDRVSDGAA